MAYRLSFVSILSVVLAASAHPPQVVHEYDMKAVYLYKLLSFVDWPPETFHSGDPISICVLGQTPIGTALQEVVNGESLDNRRVMIRRVSGVEEAGPCQLLFIASSERKRLRPILQELKSAPVLTVGETEDFLAQGGTVNFKLEGAKVRIEINMGAVERLKLHISPKLLSLARIVKE